jgi:uncharacterized protein YyaL (SSP411 family)
MRQDMALDAVEDALERAHEQIFTARETRSRPSRDEKILAGWNGLALSAFAAGAVTLDEAFAESAGDALEFLKDTLWDGNEKRLSRRYTDGIVKIDGYLEDYAFLGRGAFDLYQATGDVSHLEFALDLADAIEREFWDEDDETLYFTPQDGESLIARPQEPADQSTPSSMGVAAELLAKLAHFRPANSFEEIAAQVTETQGGRIQSNPLQHASLTLAADTVTSGSLEVTLVADGVPEQFREELRDWYLPARLLAWRPADEAEFDSWLDRLGLDESPPIWTGRDQKNEEPTAYICRDRTCSPARNDLTRALRWAERML